MLNMPIITGKNLINKLLKSGYIILRTKGSHVFLTHTKYPKRSTVVPNTPKDLPRGTLSSIRKQLKLSKEEFVNLLS
jgi:predicted RNA binding protein YcfA (HicA-like mRNA interferase family)